MIERINIMGKRIFSIVLLSQLTITSFSQNNAPAETKPAADACPAFNKKKTVSKADYFVFLRTGGSNKYNAEDFSKKKYMKQVNASQEKAPGFPGLKNENRKPEQINTIQTKSEAPVVLKEEKTEVPVSEVKQAVAAIPDERIESEKVIPVKTDKAESKGDGAAAKQEIRAKNKKHHFKKIRIKLPKIRFRKKGAATCPEF